MNRILLFLLLIIPCAITSNGQNIINRAGPANTVQDSRLSTLLNLIIPRYNDTITANLSTNRGLDSLSALIYTYDVHGMWQRIPSTGSIKKWTRILASGGGGTGTLTNLTATDVNGFAWTITNPTTTPNISLTTNVGDTRVMFANSSGGITGSANLTFRSPDLTIGVAGGATGTLNLTGATSGIITIKGQAAAGTYNFNFPTTAGSAGQVLTSQGGVGNAMTWTTVSASGVTDFSAGNLSPLFTTSVANSTTTPALSFTLSNADGGTVFANNASSSQAPSFTPVPFLGISGSTAGTITFAGVTSGAVTIKTANTAGTWDLTLPTNDGTANQVLITDGLGVSSWATISGSSITGAALTKTDDTNVTLTLGGSPTTALLNATSITVGWTGDLAFSRIEQLPTVTLAGNSTGGTADIQAITLGTGLSFVGTVLTPADNSSTNELQTIAVTGTTTGITTLSNSGGSMTIVGAGINTIGVSGSIITITGTEVDGSVTNELQTIANTSAATSHTVTLSNSGGSIQLVEGSGITLTTTGTGLDGIVTIATTAGGGSVTSVSSGNFSPLFTVSVATETTTPAFTFTASNAAAGTVFGNNTGSAAASVFTAVPVLGLAGTTAGTLGLSGVTSGLVTIQTAAAAGTYNFVLPATVGTATYLLTSQAGGTMTWTDPSSFAPATGGNYWALLGNAGTTAGTNFLGTTDNIDLVFKRENDEVIRIYSVNNYVGINTSTPAHKVDIVGGTLDAQVRALNVSGTMPTVPTDYRNDGVRFEFTAVNHAQVYGQIGMRTLMTGTDNENIVAIYGENQATSTATGVKYGNFGNNGTAQGITTGSNHGVWGYVGNGDINYAVNGLAVTAKDLAVNIGVNGHALNTGTSGIQVGGYFGLHTDLFAPTYLSAALLADNGSTTSPIALFRDNGTEKIGVYNGGSIALAGDEGTSGYLLTSAGIGNVPTWTNPASLVPTAENGDTVILGKIGLGGSFVRNTFIDGKGKDFAIGFTDLSTGAALNNFYTLADTVKHYGNDILITPSTAGGLYLSNDTTWLNHNSGDGSLWMTNSIVALETDDSIQINATRKLRLNGGIGGVYLGKASPAVTDFNYKNNVALDSILQTDADGKIIQVLASSFGVPINNILAATGANTIDNAAYPQQWQWNSISEGVAFALTSNSTAASGSGQVLFQSSLSGANANSGETTYASQIFNSHTGTGAINIAGYFSASGGASNYAIIVPSTGGSVGIGTSTPVASALTEFSSTTQGSLLPRMTGVQRVAISSPADGLLAYQTNSNDANKLLGQYQYQNGTWRRLLTDLDSASFAVAGNYITDLIGDGTATGPGTATLTLATVNSNVGTFGSSSAVPVITVNGKGLVTAVSTAGITVPTAADYWAIGGNSNSAAVTNFIGKTNNTSMRFRTNNIERMTLDSIGGLNIGTSLGNGYAINVSRSDNAAGDNLPGLNIINTNPTAATGSDYNLAVTTYTSGNGAVSAQFGTGYGTGGGALWGLGSAFYIAIRTAHPIIFATGSPTSEKFRINNDGSLKINTTPTTSASTYDILTRNTSTGVVEKVASTSITPVTLAAIGSTPNANGATLTGQVLNLEPADGSFGGVVTTGAQTFAGVKTFNNNVGIGVTPSYPLDVAGTGIVSHFGTTQALIAIGSVGTSSANSFFGGQVVALSGQDGGYMSQNIYNNAAGSWVRADASVALTSIYLQTIGGHYFYTGTTTSGTAKLEIANNGGITMSGLSGSGTRLVTASATGVLSTTPISSFTIPISSLTAAVASNTIDNAAYPQQWQWNSISEGVAFALTSNSTAASGSGQVLFQSSLSGANANSGETTYASQIFNSHTGTGAINIAGYFSASGGASNYAIIVPSTGGNVGIGTATPSLGKLQVHGDDVIVGIATTVGGTTASTASLYIGGNGTYTQTAVFSVNNPYNTGTQINNLPSALNIYNESDGGDIVLHNFYNAATPGDIIFAIGNGNALSSERMRLTTTALQLGMLNTNKGTLIFYGNTSGAVTLQPAAAAGTWSLTLPTNAGDAGQFLTTNGSGVASWAAAGGATPSWQSVMTVGNSSTIEALINIDGILVTSTDGLVLANNSATGENHWSPRLRFRSADASDAYGNFILEQQVSGTGLDAHVLVLSGGLETFEIPLLKVDYNGLTKIGLDATFTEGLLAVNPASAVVTIRAGGTLQLMGATSGSVTLSSPATPTSYTLTLPSDDGTSGYALLTNGSGVTSWGIPVGGWALLGNAGTTAGTNFLGTTDNIDLVFKRENDEVIRIYSTSNFVGIHNVAPTEMLTIGTQNVTRGYLSLATAAAGTGRVILTAGDEVPTTYTIKFPTGLPANDNDKYYWGIPNSGQATFEVLQVRVLDDAYADVNNSGTTETDLYTYTTSANTLTVNGEKLTAIWSGNFNDITATAQLRVYFAGTSIGNTGALTVSATGGFKVDVLLIKTGTTTARAVVNISTPGASTAVYTTETDLTGLNFTTTNIFKLTATAAGASGSSNDITFKLGTVSKHRAAN